MRTEIEEKFDKLCSALTSGQSVEDFFGICLNSDDLDRSYRKIAFILHPDKWAGSALYDKASSHFPLLAERKAEAERKIENKVYGIKNPFYGTEISTKKTIYKIIELIAEGDLTNVFSATCPDGALVILKVSKNIGNADLIKAEKESIAHIYSKLEPKKDKISHHIVPPLIDSFEFQDGGERKIVNVFHYIRNCVTIKQIIEKYPNGIDIQDAAWMLNRILTSLVVLKDSGIVHGAITPDNYLLDLENHNGYLIDFCFSVKNESKLKAISSNYKHFYPKEVFEKIPVNHGLDLFMMGKLFLNLVGGNKMVFPASVPRSIVSLFSACFLGRIHRYSDALEFYKDFREAQTRAFGPSKFRTFKL